MSQPQPQGRGCPVCFKSGPACKCGEPKVVIHKRTLNRSQLEILCERLKSKPFERRWDIGQIADLLPSGKFYDHPNHATPEEYDADIRWWADVSERVAHLGEFTIVATADGLVQLVERYVDRENV
jgi:hypothetical protein